MNKKLNDAGIGTGVYYPIPINEQEFYKGLGYVNDTPIATEMTNKVLSLPIHPSVSQKDLDFIIDTINAITK